MYESLANKYYANDPRLRKAIAAGRAMDNALKKEYGPEGATRCHFMMDNYLAYFDKLPTYLQENNNFLTP